jgi:hypothetical protein
MHLIAVPEPIVVRAILTAADVAAHRGARCTLSEEVTVGPRYQMSRMKKIKDIITEV